MFSHVKNIPLIFEKIGNISIDAVGVSTRPRDIEGSYMPCFLVGYSIAKAISETSGKPLFEFSHQQGHIMAALYSAKREDLWNDKFVAFHVSGGTTELLYVENGKITKIGGTLDLNAGQLIDRIGVKIGLNFPCGPKLEKIAAPLKDVDCTSHVRNLECNLSGIENKATMMIENSVDNSVVAAYIIKSVLQTVKKLTHNALKIYGKIPVLYAGGVMSNKLIQESLSEYENAVFSEPQFSCDNAAGIAFVSKQLL